MFTCVNKGEVDNEKTVGPLLFTCMHEEGAVDNEKTVSPLSFTCIHEEGVKKKTLDSHPSFSVHQRGFEKL